MKKFQITILFLIIFLLGNYQEAKSQTLGDLLKNEAEETKEAESVEIENYLSQELLSEIKELDQGWPKDSSEICDEYNAEIVKRWNSLKEKQKDECLNRTEANNEKSKLFIDFNISRRACITKLREAAGKYKNDKKVLIDDLEIGSLQAADKEEGGKTRALARAAVESFAEDKRNEVDNEYKENSSNINTLATSMKDELQTLGSKSKIVEGDKAGKMICYQVKIF